MVLRKGLAVVAFALFLTATLDDLVVAFAQKEEPKIAIFPFLDANVAAKREGYGEAISAMLMTELINGRVFQVIERSEIERMMQEQAFQLTGAVDVKTAKEIGRIYGVDILVFGSVAKFRPMVETDIRLIDTETGEAIAAEHGRSEREVEIRDMVSRLARRIEGKYLGEEVIVEKPPVEEPVAEKPGVEMPIPKPPVPKPYEYVKGKWGLSFMFGYYNPSLETFNDNLELLNSAINSYYGASLTDRSNLDGIKAVGTFGFRLKHYFNPSLSALLSVDYFSGESKDNYKGGYWDQYDYWHEVEGDVNIELSTTMVFLSLLYDFLPLKMITPYVGAGVGTYSTTMKSEVSERDIIQGTSFREFRETRESDPVGFGGQLLGGIGFFVSRHLSIDVQAKYLFGTAENEDEVFPPAEGYKGDEVELTGFLLGGQLVYLF